jgi:hypothetical protein
MTSTPAGTETGPIASAPTAPKPTGAPSNGGPSLGELVSNATRDLSLLVHQEIELAKAELKQTAKQGGIGAGLVAAAGVLAFFSVFAIMIFIGELLTWAGLERFWSYLIVAGIFLLVAAILGLIARSRFNKVKAPERTITTVKDDVAWIKHPTTAPANGSAVPAKQPTSAG